MSLTIAVWCDICKRAGTEVMQADWEDNAEAFERLCPPTHGKRCEHLCDECRKKAGQAVFSVLTQILQARTGLKP